MNLKSLQAISFQSKSAQNQQSEFITCPTLSSAELVVLLNEASHVNNTRSQTELTAPISSKGQS